jgi:hypothetical protein
MLPWKKILIEIDTQKQVISKLIDRYNLYSLKRGIDGDDVENIWAEHFEIAY